MPICILVKSNELVNQESRSNQVKGFGDELRKINKAITADYGNCLLICLFLVNCQ